MVGVLSAERQPVGGEFDLFKFQTGYVDFWQYLHISVIFNLLVLEGQNNGFGY